MVAGIDGDGGGSVEGLNKGEVVGAHVGETLGVLINEGGLGDGVGTGEVAGEEEVGAVSGGGAHGGGGCGVVGPVGLDRGVLHGKEEHLDGMGETDIVGGGVSGVVGLGRSCLHLLDKNITRGTSHALTLIVRHDGIVSPDLDIVKINGGAGEIGAVGGTSGLVDDGSGGGSDHIPSSKKVKETTERKVETHVVVRKSSGGERHTRITSIEERKGKVEHLGRENKRRINEIAGSTNHVGISNLLGTGDGKGSPEIQLEVAETSGHQVVEGNASLANQVVRKVGRPGQVGLEAATIGQDGRSSGCGRDNRGDSETEPCVEQVVTRTRNGHRPLLSEPRCS